MISRWWKFFREWWRRFSSDDKPRQKGDPMNLMENAARPECYQDLIQVVPLGSEGYDVAVKYNGFSFGWVIGKS